MNGKIALLVLLLCLGSVDALWVYTDKSEYMPMETVRLTVSDGKGAIIVDVLNENGENVYHATRTAKHGETSEWGYTYYYPEEFNLSLKSGKYDVKVRDDFENVSSVFEITSVGLAAVVNKEGTGVFLHKDTGAAIEGAKITLYYNKTGAIETVETTTGAGGYFSFDTKNLTKIVGEFESEKAEIEIYQNYYWYGYDYYYPYYYEQYSSYVFSDKTLYQPGETVHISSVILLVNDTAYETVTGPFEVTVRGPDYNVLYSTNVSAINSRVNFDFPILEEAALGYYNVEIRRNESTYVGYYSFEVQEYKRPEIKLTLTPAEEIYELNKTVRVNVSSEYYFGGAANAEVHFEIYRSPYYWPFYKCGYRCMPYWGEEKVAEGLVYTKKGVGEIAWGGANQTGDYRIKAWATDESEIQTESETTVTVLEKVNLDALFSEMNLNESGLITVISYDKDEQPLDLDVNVKIYTEEWYYPPIYYAEGVRSDGVSVAPIYEEPKYNRTLVFEKNITTTNGQESFEFTPHQYGNYVIEMQSGEYSGKENFYVSEYGWWNSGQITIELDKAEYLKGEMMNITVTSPKGGKLFVVGMGSTPSITAYSVTPGINLIRMPALETSSMEFFLVDEGQRYTAYANYVVRGKDWVKVDIASNGVYRPGDAARLIISAQRDGVNSNAAASIAIVDQSIIDLSKASWNDIYTYMYGYSREGYQLLFSWDYYGGVYPLYKGGVMMDGMMVEEAALPTVPGQATNGGAPSRESISIRKKFPETAFWIPYFMIEGGKKEIIWHIPDTLTTWNVTVVANEGVNVGMGTSSIVVTKDVIGRMSPPPGLVEGDAAAIPVTVFNYGSERKTFTVTLEASKNIEIMGSPKRYVSVEPDTYVSMDIPVKAIESGTANFTLWVEGGEGDAVLLPIEVKPLGVEIVKGESGLVEGTPVEVKYTTPEDAEVTLSLYSSVLSSAFGSLDYLVSYPYGCIEQTMSGFLPTVVLVHTTQELGLTYAGDANITGIIDDGLVRIYSFQNSDGSWGWFRGNDERISAYVMDGLRVAKESGVVVDPAAYSKGEQWLSANAETPYGKFVLNRLNSGKVATYSSDAFGALTECEDGKCDALISKLECTSNYCSLGYDGEMDWYHDETELTSYAVSALVKNGKTEQARKCVNWLMLNKKRSYWVSTKDTAISVLGLSAYAKETGELRSDYIAKVSVDSSKVLEKRLGYQTVGSEEISLPAGWHTIALQRDGFGPLYYTLTQRYYSMEIPEGDWEVNRNYDRTVAKVGDEIVVTLKVNGTGQYVAIEDPIPLGTEIVKQSGNEWMYYGDWWYGGYRMEARQDRAVFFFDRMDNPQITYKLRVTHKGDFTALPTHAYNMYAEEVGGYSDFQHFTFYQKAKIEPYVTEFNTTLRIYWEGPGPAEIVVKANGAEQTYTVNEGQNEIVVQTTGPVEYAFKSESEYYEGETGKSATASAGTGGTQGGTAANYLPLLAILALLGVALIAVYFWKKK